MTSSFLLMWFLLLKSASRAHSIDAHSCSIRFYSIQYFKGNSWTLDSFGDWKYNTDTPFRHPIGKFQPKSIRTYGTTNTCKEIWRVCPFGALRKRKTTKCRSLRHGEDLASVSKWGWSNDFLGRVIKLGDRIKATTSLPSPYPSLPLKVPKEVAISRNMNITKSISLAAEKNEGEDEYKEDDRTSAAPIRLMHNHTGT